MKFGTVFRGRKQSKFNPNHAFVDDAIQEFLQNGGQISRVDSIDKDYQGFLTAREIMAPADEFLMDLVRV